MSIAETATPPSTAADAHEDLSGARVLQFKQALHDKTAAVSEWALEKADAARGKAAERPLAAAGVSAGAAFVGGLLLGLLMASRLGGLRGQAQSLVDRARALLKV